jgi:hypothetical protein
MVTPSEDRPAAKRSRAPNRPSKPVSISAEDRVSLYSLARFLPSSLEEKCGLRIPLVTYFQDPFVAGSDPAMAFDENTSVHWEPNLSDGPTSARFAVVDFDADSGILTPPAVWDDSASAFTFQGEKLTKEHAHLFQFHQVSVWAILQNALAYFESGNGLGRPIPWAFEGNRLIVVPHAGNGRNAFYDRTSKSLQFYYFANGDKTTYTCLSTDIVCHEFGHAVLDGIRPLYNESVSPQTAAFHEFFGDLSAILLTLRNNELRRHLAKNTGGKIESATTLSSVAEEFGNAISGRPYLRSAKNEDTLQSLSPNAGPHRLSQVLTGAMFDILIRIADQYQSAPSDSQSRKSSPAKAFWDAAERMQRTAIQPLDLLPPVEVTFRDYALAVCRAQQLADPIDPRQYRKILIEAFHKRGIFSAADVDELNQPQYLTDRLNVSVFHDIDEISRSHAAAYRFLDDNREDLLIPASQDVIVAGLYDTKKLARQRLPLPRQIVLQYVWREDVPLNGPEFGPYNGKSTTMLCGGTLVFASNGNVLSWTIKSGSAPYGGKRSRTGKVADRWAAAAAEGAARRQELTTTIAALIASGRAGAILGSPNGILATHVPPVIVESEGDAVRFHLAPHLHLSEESDIDDEESGERQWQISC